MSGARPNSMAKIDFSESSRVDSSSLQEHDSDDEDLVIELHELVNPPPPSYQAPEGAPPEIRQETASEVHQREEPTINFYRPRAEHKVRTFLLATGLVVFFVLSTTFITLYVIEVHHSKMIQAPPAVPEITIVPFHQPQVNTTDCTFRYNGTTAELCSDNLQNYCNETVVVPLSDPGNDSSNPFGDCSPIYRYFYCDRVSRPCAPMAAFCSRWQRGSNLNATTAIGTNSTGEEPSGSSATISSSIISSSSLKSSHYHSKPLGGLAADIHRNWRYSLHPLKPYA